MNNQQSRDLGDVVRERICAEVFEHPDAATIRTALRASWISWGGQSRSTNQPAKRSPVFMIGWSRFCKSNRRRPVATRVKRGRSYARRGPKSSLTRNALAVSRRSVHRKANALSTNALHAYCQERPLCIASIEQLEFAIGQLSKYRMMRDAR